MGATSFGLPEMSTLSRFFIIVFSFDGQLYFLPDNPYSVSVGLNRQAKDRSQEDKTEDPSKTDLHDDCNWLNSTSHFCFHHQLSSLKMLDVAQV